MVKAGAFRCDIVGDDQVVVFGGELLSSVYRDVLGFRGKADDESVTFCSRDADENIGCGLERERHRFFVALVFLAVGLGGPIVSNGGGKERDGAVRNFLKDG